jgi:hypothetical protein
MFGRQARDAYGRENPGYNAMRHVVLKPRYGHVGYAEVYNKKIAYLWLWAHKAGYFN